MAWPLINQLINLGSVYGIYEYTFVCMLMVYVRYTYGSGEWVGVSVYV